MQWYEYKMEADDLTSPKELKAKLLAMADTLPEEELARPMMAAPAAQKPEPEKAGRKKPIRFPGRPLGTLAACLAVCVVGYGAFATGMVGMGARSSNLAEYSADSTAAAGVQSHMMAAMDTSGVLPEAASYTLGDENGTAALSEGDAAAEGSRSTDSSKIIYTANLTLESKDYEAARAALDSALQDADGYLESSSEYTRSNESRSVSLTLRVPQSNYSSFLAAAAQAGNVTSQSQDAEDVTTQYMDVEARLASLEAQRTRLQQLQEQADNLSDLLEIESSLSDVQYQIESWQSQLDWYSDQVDCCTVYITLNEVQTYSPPSESFGSRISTAFTDGWKAFVDGAKQLAVWLIYIWPAAVLVLAAAAAVFFWRKKRHLKK